MSRVVIYPYKMKSRSASKLQEFLEREDADCIRVYPDRDYRPRKNDLIIGWGSGNWPAWRREADRTNTLWLNPSDKIDHAINKPTTFSLFKAAHVACPEFTSRIGKARQWLDNGLTVLARQELEGHDGSGLVIISNPEDLVKAELYTLYENKTAEYRVHVFQGEVFWAQERAPIENEDSKYYTATPDKKIRTSSKGWALYVANASCPRRCKTEAVKAISALDLDFGCVDIGYNQREETPVCYEVNTAPELTDRTCRAYAQQIMKLIGN